MVYQNVSSNWLTITCSSQWNCWLVDPFVPFSGEIIRRWWIPSCFILIYLPDLSDQKVFLRLLLFLLPPFLSLQCSRAKAHHHATLKCRSFLGSYHLRHCRTSLCSRRFHHRYLWLYQRTLLNSSVSQRSLIASLDWSLRRMQYKLKKWLDQRLLVCQRSFW